MKLKLVSLIFLGVSCLFTACNSENQSVDSSPTPPNVIYILADDLGIGDVGPFNENSKIPTPHLDQLAAEGMIFNNAHTSSAVCTPTRYGILTGRYNWRSSLKNGVLTGKSKALISPERTTVASMLQKQGYHTAFIGKWHLGWNWALKDSSGFGGTGWNYEDFENLDFTKEVSENPNDRGFAYAYGHSGSLDMAPYVYVENGKVTALPDTVTERKGDYHWWRKGPTGSDFDHEQVTPNFFERSVKYISEHASSDEPFFLYLALPSPHTPILPLPEWQGKSQLNPYADFVMMIDDYVGQMLAELEKTGEADNTIVIFTSDNGCSPQAKFPLLKEKGHNPSYIYRGHKADIYEGGHRVPFILRWPKKVSAGQKSDKLICTTDLIATMADITDYTLAEDEGEDSYSMLPLMRNDPESHQRKSAIHHSIDGRFAIRKGDWKLIFARGSGGWSQPNAKSEDFRDYPPLQLYNLKEDPGETSNVIDNHPEIQQQLTQELFEIIDNGRSTQGAIQTNDEPMRGSWHQLDSLAKYRGM